ncbi:Uu.00g131170.m01.CDS01 [Anthostomella pinea]|uniref:Uu.00g131170.m01.CDS01 n=1 Tax=Anthostomella pinea TaxID=933095 RepID=A0AAI8VIS0_9PEZI|nr:Uu.00g131170.m01.CDS01 [Anthostomella pinea]
MRYFHSDLAVLNAEQYDDGRVTKRPGSGAALKAKGSARVPPKNAPNPKKRTRKASGVDGNEPSEEGKRARGRPRLDLKDEVSAERRRAQIRDAQRAYRERKEISIARLEAEVEALKDTNKDVKTAYQKIIDYANRHGILEQAPEFGHQLQQFQALVEGIIVKDPEENEATPIKSLEGSPREKRTEWKTSTTDNRPEEPVTQSTSKGDHQAQPLLGGIVVSHEPVQHQLPHDLALNLDPSLNDPVEYEIMAAPTSENASFISNLAFDTSFMDSPNTPWTHSPWSTLPAPRTFSFGEWSFSRRLHRFAIEKAVGLLTTQNPPPARMSRVFGFVRLFETIEEIRTRTIATLAAMNSEPLNDWRQPFHHIGASGTHFITGKDGDKTYPDAPPYPSTGYGMGPFDERTMNVRSSLLGMSNYLNIDGMGGDWYDAYDVEAYLARNGIIIPPTAEIQTVELQPGDFLYGQHVQTPSSVGGNPSSAAHLGTEMGLGMNSSSVPALAQPLMGSAAAEYMSPVSSGDGMSVSASTPPNAFSMSTDNFIGVGLQSAPESVSGVATFGNNSPASDFVPNANFMYPSPHGSIPVPAAGPASKRVLLDVGKFVHMLVSRATCMGRAPAFRPMDVVSAFWESVVAE